MPPQLASLLTILLILFLFRRDCKENPNITNAHWLPLIWFFFIISRPATMWLAIFGIRIGGGSSVEEGNLINSIVSLVLILLAIKVLVSRSVSFDDIYKQNKWLVYYLLFCLLAVTWSDFPIVSIISSLRSILLLGAYMG